MAVTSRTFAGQPVSDAHPALRGVTDLAFTDALEPGVVRRRLRLRRARRRCGGRRPPARVGLRRPRSSTSRPTTASPRRALPGVVRLRAPHPRRAAGRRLRPRRRLPRSGLPGARLVANPGCFATGLSLALWPLGGLLGRVRGERDRPHRAPPARARARRPRRTSRRATATSAPTRSLGAPAPRRGRADARAGAAVHFVPVVAGRGRAASGARRTSRSPRRVTPRRT